jgi:hypothetical protein
MIWWDLALDVSELDASSHVLSMRDFLCEFGIFVCEHRSSRLSARCIGDRGI